MVFDSEILTIKNFLLHAVWPKQLLDDSTDLNSEETEATNSNSSISFYATSPITEGRARAFPCLSPQPQHGSCMPEIVTTGYSDFAYRLKSLGNH